MAKLDALNKKPLQSVERVTLFEGTEDELRIDFNMAGISNRMRVELQKVGKSNDADRQLALVVDLLSAVVVDINLEDAAGKPLPVSTDLFNDMSMELLGLIAGAVLEKTQEKKARNATSSGKLSSETRPPSRPGGRTPSAKRAPSSAHVHRGN